MFPNHTNSKAGKATPAINQLSFFNQIVGGPNPLNPREMVVQVVPGSGISARDYFAAHALHTSTFVESSRDLAEWAYRVADAMLKAREEKPTDGK